MEPVEAQELAWLDLRQSRIDGIPSLVGDVLPDAYPRYCRMLAMLRWPKTRLRWDEMRGHLLPRLSADRSPEALAEVTAILEGMTWSGPEHRWSEVAACLGVSLTGETTPADLAAALPPEERDEFWKPETFGGLTDEQLEGVCVNLRAHTSSDKLYVARWEGIGGGWRPRDRSPIELRPGWRYFAFRVDLAELPNYVDYYGHILWPADRGWVLNEDMNTKSIYVAGSDSLVKDLIGHPALDCFRVGVEDPAW